ncbi:MAG: FRG domain-containing protein [Leptospira sp.]|nr:FRG domain-containing protein [Leptospira sp.]
MDEFWEYLDPRNPLKKNFSLEVCENILYRGQSDAEWALIPSAMRNFIKKENFQNFNFYKVCIKNEFEDLARYVGDSSFRQDMPEGLPTIDLETFFDTEKLNDIFSDISRQIIWPSEEFLPFSAVVQHRGIGTSLLDWSKHPLIAVFFAAVSHIRQDHRLVNTKELSVWIYISKPILNNRIKIHDPLSSEINLKAQFGKFSSIVQFTNNPDSFHLDTLDTLCDETNLFKLTIDKNYAPILLKYCHHHFIDHSSLYPADGERITKKISDKKHWKNMLDKVQPISLFNDPSLDIKDTI